MNAPVSPPTIIAPVALWPNIHVMFRHGSDTLSIAQNLGLSEAAVYNALAAMRARAA